MESRELEETIRQYLRGELSAPDREAFEEAFIGRPEIVEKLELNSLFSKYAPQALGKKKASGVKFRWLIESPLGASLSTLTACLVIGAVMVFQVERVRDTPRASAGVFSERSQIIALKALRGADNEVVYNSDIDRVVFKARLGAGAMTDSGRLAVVVADRSNQKTVAVFEDVATLDHLSHREIVFSLPMRLLSGASYKVVVVDEDKHTVEEFSLSVDAP